MPQRSKTSLLEGQSNKGGIQVPPAHPTTTHQSCTTDSVWLHGTALGCHGFEALSPTRFPCWVGHLGPDDRFTGEASIFPRKHKPLSTNLQRSEMPENCKTAKKTNKTNLLIQCYLLENNRKSSYRSIREVPLPHRCLDIKRTHQIP